MTEADRADSTVDAAGEAGSAAAPRPRRAPLASPAGDHGHRIGLLVNPASGTGRGAGVGARAAERLRGHGHEVVVVSGDSAAAAAAAAHRAVAATGPDTLDALVVVGGDGAVHLGVNAVAGRAVPLGIVPAGSGNDIARGLDLPLQPDEAVDGLDGWLRAGSVRPVDAVRVTALTGGDGGGDGGGGDGPGGDGGGGDGSGGDGGDGRGDGGDDGGDGGGDGSGGGGRWVAGVLAAGLDAVVNERANGWRWPRGRAKYNLAIALVLPTYRPRRYRVLLDGEPWHVDALLLAVANTSSYGGAMRIAPDASPTDGLLDVVAIGPVSLPRFARLFPRVYAGTHTAVDVVDVRRAATVELTLDDGRRPIVGYGDGERLTPLPLRLEAVPQALSVLAPPPARGHGSGP